MVVMVVWAVVMGRTAALPDEVRADVLVLRRHGGRLLCGLLLSLSLFALFNPDRWYARASVGVGGDYGNLGTERPKASIPPQASTLPMYMYTCTQISMLDWTRMLKHRSMFGYDGAAMVFVLDLISIEKSHYPLKRTTLDQEIVPASNSNGATEHDTLHRRES